MRYSINYPLEIELEVNAAAKAHHFVNCLQMNITEKAFLYGVGEELVDF